MPIACVDVGHGIRFTLAGQAYREAGILEKRNHPATIPAVGCIRVVFVYRALHDKPWEDGLVSALDDYGLDSEAEQLSPVTAAYIDAHTRRGDLVVDPFCRSADIVQMALSMGRPAAAVSFQPLDVLRTKVALQGCASRELLGALTRLGDAPKQDRTLSEHLQGLYQTSCRQCDRPSSAEYYIWEDDAPVQVFQRCPACGWADLQGYRVPADGVVPAVNRRGLHYWYLLDRVAREGDPGRKMTMALLDLYTPRSLYVLASLLMRIEDLFTGSSTYDCLRVALLNCMQMGSKLHPASDVLPARRRAQLSPATRFVERNLWHHFEQSVRSLAAHVSGAEPPLTHDLPALFEDAGKAQSDDHPAAFLKAYVGHLSVRELAAKAPRAGVELMISAPPLMGREYWALSYLWTGWLFGRGAATRIWPLVRRRSADWSWYARAMRTSLAYLRSALTETGTVVLLARDQPLPYYEAVCLAGAGAQLALADTVYHPVGFDSATQPFEGSRGEYRLCWRARKIAPSRTMPLDELAGAVRRIALDAAVEVLNQRAEPTKYGRLHENVLRSLEQHGLLHVLMSLMSEQASFTPLQFLREQVRATLNDALHDSLDLIRNGEEGECWWWLIKPPSTPPLSERVEQAVFDALVAEHNVQVADLQRRIYEQFPGPLTPDSEWIVACVKSYAEPGEADIWSLKAEEEPAQRAQIRSAMLLRLQELGERMGFRTQGGLLGLDLVWQSGKVPEVGYALLDSVALQPLLLLAPANPPARLIAVVSDSRAELTRLALGRNVWLRNKLAERGWRLLRESEICQWSERSDVALQDLNAISGLEWLPAQERTQLSLI